MFVFALHGRSEPVFERISDLLTIVGLSALSQLFCGFSPAWRIYSLFFAALAHSFLCALQSLRWHCTEQ